MENHRILDVDNDIHMFALHALFLPRIEKDLRLWQVAHNSHNIRTERNKTHPRQLWHESFLTNSQSDYSSIRNVLHSDDATRADQIRLFRDQPEFPEPDDISIVITRIPSPLTDEQLRNLHENIDVNQSSESFGIDIHAFFFISKAFFSPRLGVA